MWMQINLFLSSLGKTKKPLVTLKDKNISKMIFEKTNTRLDYIKISESDKPFGMMMGIPFFPQLILSRKLHETFNKDEIEYVILHEMGHANLWHSTQELLAGIIFFIAGLVVLNRFSGVIGVVIAIILGLVFGILMIQFAKFKEIEADKYSLKRLTNPKGMITATHKFHKAYVEPSEINAIVRFLFYRGNPGNPYPNRIRMAKIEEKNRK